MPAKRVARVVAKGQSRQSRSAQKNRALRPVPAVEKPPEPAAPHLIGYARVSMSDQSNQRQIDDLVRYGVDPSGIYKDTASGRTMKRPGWIACWKDLREGDVLVVHAIDRLGRDILKLQARDEQEGICT